MMATELTPEIVVAQAREIVRRGEGWGHGKAFIMDVADELDVDVDDLAPRLLRWQRDGKIRLQRADLVAAMPAAAVRHSEIEDPRSGARYHFIETWSGNPSRRDVDAAVAKYREFHRLAPRKIGEFPRAMKMPAEVYVLGKAVHVMYRSSKVDPDTLKKPDEPINYIHEHDAGVMAYTVSHDAVPPPEVVAAVPAFLREADGLVLLGKCLGFAYKHEGEVFELEASPPMPELYCTPCGKGLVIIESRREIVSLLWGGGLGVEGRGIVG